MSWLTTFIGHLLEEGYQALPGGATPTASQLGVKLAVIKAISADEGSAQAATWLTNADPVLGPIASQVISAVNGNLSAAVTTVIELLSTGQASS